MKTGARARMVLVTCANRKEARSIAQNVVKKRFAACVNILPAAVESTYRWKGKVESARELLLLIKTSAKRLPELEREVKRWHSYKTPEFIVIPIVAGSREYLGWIENSIQPT